MGQNLYNINGKNACYILCIRISKVANNCGTWFCKNLQACVFLSLLAGFQALMSTLFRVLLFSSGSADQQVRSVGRVQ